MPTFLSSLDVANKLITYSDKEFNFLEWQNIEYTEEVPNIFQLMDIQKILHPHLNGITPFHNNENTTLRVTTYFSFVVWF